MAHTTLIPYSAANTNRTPRRRHWRRHTTMTINSKSKMESTASSSPSHLVHISTSHLPDIVNDCQRRTATFQIDTIHSMDDQTKLTCKQIAHSLRIVADQVDAKYCQNERFHHEFYSLTIRFVSHTLHLRTILYTVWTRSLVPFILFIFKSKPII